MTSGIVIVSSKTNEHLYEEEKSLLVTSDRQSVAIKPKSNLRRNTIIKKGGGRGWYGTSAHP